MRCLAALLAAFALSAETGAFVRGVLVTCQAQAGTGELSLRDAGGRVLRYRFDHKTYMERENARIIAERDEALKVTHQLIPLLTGQLVDVYGFGDA